MTSIDDSMNFLTDTPYLYSHIVTSGNNMLPIRLPYYSIHNVRMTSVCGKLAQRSYIPYLDCSITIPRSYTFTIRRPFYCIHRESTMSTISSNQFSVGSTPYLDKLVRTSRYYTLTVRRPCQSSYPVRMTSKCIKNF